MIQWNADLSRRMVCTSEEKLDLIPLIRKFMELTAVFRAEGMASLEARARGLGDSLLTAGIRLMSEGISGETLEDILSTYIAVSADSGISFLKSCVIAEGIISLSNGDEIPLLVRKLTAYFGAESAIPLLDELESPPPAAREAT